MLFALTEKKILDNQLRLYKREKKANTTRDKIKKGVRPKEPTKKKTSLTKEGKGGADKVKKKDRRENSVTKGEKRTRPRRATS